MSQIEYVTAQIDNGAHLIPGHMVGAIKLYILEGIQPGGFLSALLSNDFMGAANRADDENGAALMGWARFLYNHVPGGSFGSPARFNAWLDKGGVNGAERAEAA